MTQKSVGSLVLFLCIILIGASAGFYAYEQPENIESAARPAISALSIIFGLSTAVSSLLIPQVEINGSSSNDPHLAKRQKDRAKQDDVKTLFRLVRLHLVALSAIILGICYLVALKGHPCSTVTNILACLFASTSIVCLLYTMLLPNLVAALIRRNDRLQQHRGDEK